MVERERFVQVSPQETQFEQDHTNSGKRSDNCVFFSWILDLIDNNITITSKHTLRDGVNNHLLRSTKLVAPDNPGEEVGCSRLWGITGMIYSIQKPPSNRGYLNK